MSGERYRLTWASSIRFAPTTTHIMYQVFLCNLFNINMWVQISIGGLFSEKILLSVRHFPTFVSKITTFNLFKMYYNTHLQSKTFHILNIWSLSVKKIVKTCYSKFVGICMFANLIKTMCEIRYAPLSQFILTPRWTFSYPIKMVLAQSFQLGSFTGCRGKGLRYIILNRFSEAYLHESFRC